MKASEIDEAFDRGEDISDYLDWSTARRPNLLKDRDMIDPQLAQQLEACLVAYDMDRTRILPSSAPP